MSYASEQNDALFTNMNMLLNLMFDKDKGIALCYAVCSDLQLSRQPVTET